MQETVGDLVGTAGDLNVTALVQEVLADTRLEKAYFKTQEMYREATTGRFGSVAWLRSADDSLADVNKAAKLFNSQAKWSEAVNSPDYERLSAKVFDHATKGLVRRFGS